MIKEGYINPATIKKARNFPKELKDSIKWNVLTYFEITNIEYSNKKKIDCGWE